MKEEYTADLSVEDKGITFLEFTQKYLKEQIQ